MESNSVSLTKTLVFASKNSAVTEGLTVFDKLVGCEYFGQKVEYLKNVLNRLACKKIELFYNFEEKKVFSLPKADCFPFFGLINTVEDLFNEPNQREDAFTILAILIKEADNAYEKISQF
jgi:hypothetical protein